MDTLIYIWLVLIIQFVLITYYGLSNFPNLLFKFNKEKIFKFQIPLSKITFNRIAFFNSKIDNSKFNDSNHNIEKELIKCKEQLRRNLMTLNYMTVLELSSQRNKQSDANNEEQSLRKSLQLEVIRNSRLVKHYIALLVK